MEFMPIEAEDIPEISYKLRFTEIRLDNSYCDDGNSSHDDDNNIIYWPCLYFESYENMSKSLENENFITKECKMIMTKAYLACVLTNNGQTPQDYIYLLGKEILPNGHKNSIIFRTWNQADELANLNIVSFEDNVPFFFSKYFHVPGYKEAIFEAWKILNSKVDKNKKRKQSSDETNNEEENHQKRNQSMSNKKQLIEIKQLVDAELQQEHEVNGQQQRRDNEAELQEQLGDNEDKLQLKQRKFQQEGNDEDKLQHPQQKKEDKIVNENENENENEVENEIEKDNENEKENEIANENENEIENEKEIEKETESKNVIENEKEIENETEKENEKENENKNDIINEEKKEVVSCSNNNYNRKEGTPDDNCNLMHETANELSDDSDKNDDVDSGITPALIEEGKNDDDDIKVKANKDSQKGNENKQLNVNYDEADLSSSINDNENKHNNKDDLMQNGKIEKNNNKSTNTKKKNQNRKDNKNDIKNKRATVDDEDDVTPTNATRRTLRSRTNKKRQRSEDEDNDESQENLIINNNNNRTPPPNKKQRKTKRNLLLKIITKPINNANLPTFESVQDILELLGFQFVSSSNNTKNKDNKFCILPYKPEEDDEDESSLASAALHFYDDNENHYYFKTEDDFRKYLCRFGIRYVLPTSENIKNHGQRTNNVSFYKLLKKYNNNNELTSKEENDEDDEEKHIYESIMNLKRYIRFSMVTSLYKKKKIPRKIDPLSWREAWGLLRKIGVYYTGGCYFLPTKKLSSSSTSTTGVNNSNGSSNKKDHDATSDIYFESIEKLSEYLAKFGLPEGCNVNELSSEELLSLEFYLKDYGMAHIGIFLMINPEKGYGARRTRRSSVLSPTIRIHKSLKKYNRRKRYFCTKNKNDNSKDTLNNNTKKNNKNNYENNNMNDTEKEIKRKDSNCFLYIYPDSPEPFPATTAEEKRTNSITKRQLGGNNDDGNNNNNIMNNNDSPSNKELPSTSRSNAYYVGDKGIVTPDSTSSNKNLSKQQQQGSIVSYNKDTDCVSTSSRISDDDNNSSNSNCTGDDLASTAAITIVTTATEDDSGERDTPIKLPVTVTGDDDCNNYSSNTRRNDKIENNNLTMINEVETAHEFIENQTTTDDHIDEVKKKEEYVGEEKKEEVIIENENQNNEKDNSYNNNHNNQSNNDSIKDKVFSSITKSVDNADNALITIKGTFQHDYSSNETTKTKTEQQLNQQRQLTSNSTSHTNNIGNNRRSSTEDSNDTKFNCKKTNTQKTNDLTKQMPINKCGDGKVVIATTASMSDKTNGSYIKKEATKNENHNNRCTSEPDSDEEKIKKQHEVKRTMNYSSESTSLGISHDNNACSNDEDLVSTAPVTVLKTTIDDSRAKKPSISLSFCGGRVEHKEIVGKLEGLDQNSERGMVEEDVKAKQNLKKEIEFGDDMDKVENKGSEGILENDAVAPLSMSVVGPADMASPSTRQGANQSNDDADQDSKPERSCFYYMEF